MLVVEFNPDRPREDGQFHVRLIDAASGDFGEAPHRQTQAGYWCDLGHLRSGVLAPIEAAIAKAECHRLAGDIGNDKPRFRAIHTSGSEWLVVDLFYGSVKATTDSNQGAIHIANLMNKEIVK